MEELERECVDLINLARNMIHWRDVASTAMDLSGFTEDAEVRELLSDC
jgi:hypothetical protein